MRSDGLVLSIGLIPGDTLLDALLELPCRRTDGTGEIGELLGTEQEHDDNENDENLGSTEVSNHVELLSYPRV